MSFQLMLPFLNFLELRREGGRERERDGMGKKADYSMNFIETCLVIVDHVQLPFPLLIQRVKVH